MVHRVHRDVAARVACAHNQHALAFELLGFFVGRGVQHLPAELAWPLRHIGLSQDAVGDHHAFVFVGFHLPVARIEGHAPQGVGRIAHRLDLQHAHAKTVVAFQVKVLRISLEVGKQLTVAGVIGRALGHGEFFELGGAFARNQVG